MARPLRIEYPGAIYHVTSRGDGREAIFLEEEDRKEFLSVFEDVIRRMNWKCSAYCLMGNHYHLVIETPEGNLSKGMRQLNGVYTQRFNRLHDRSGHVFQGRYKAILVERENYLKELCRYVVLNPVRAGMVNNPAEWPWSSYVATLGLAPKPEWLEVEWLLSQFEKKSKKARKAYREFVLEGIGLPSIWEKLRHQIYLGQDDFVEDALTRTGLRKNQEEIPQAQRYPSRNLQYYAENNADPKQAMAEAYLSGGYTLAEVAKYFGVHYTTVSRVVKRHENQSKSTS